jgi:adenylate cyclase
LRHATGIHAPANRVPIRVKKHIVRICLGLLVVLIFIGHAAKYYQLPLIDKMEAIVYDTRLQLTMPRTLDSRIVIVDIDEKSLRKPEDGGEGHWPWPRNRLAVMLDQLFDRYQVAVVGFDVVFAEKDESSGLNVLETLAGKQLKEVPQFEHALAQLRPQLEYDQLFANSMKNRAVVLGYYFSSVESDGGGKGNTSGVLPEPVLPAGTFAGKNIAFTSWIGYGANLPELMQAAASAGHFNPWTDDDGVSRRVPMLAEYKGAYYEPLSLAMVRVLLNSPKVKPGYPEDQLWSRNYSGLEWLELVIAPPDRSSSGSGAANRSLKIPVDERVTALVPFRGKQGSFKYVSAADVIHARLDPAELKGKIVLVGTTAPGLLDLRSTPVAPVYPGVEIHANLIAGMLDQNIKQKPPYVLGAEVALLFISGLAMALLLPLLSPLKSLMVTLAVLSAALAVNLMVFHYGNLVLPLASGLVMILVLFALNTSYGYFIEARGKRQITGLFGQYVPPELVDEMAKNPESFSMEGESREMTVLFSDVRGFTTISEGLDPKELSNLMNEFLTPLTEVIYRHRGTIDKYMGDCIMAFWGAPLPDKEHARSGILAGLEMHAKLTELQPSFKSKGWPEIRIGVGLNSGRMSVGNMGSQIRLAYTVMGDAVNLASRLEGITKEYGAAIIVGEGTKDLVPDIVFRELDKVRVKGKDEPVAMYEPLGLQGQVSKAKLDEIKFYAQFLRLYRGQDWDQAELQLFNLQKMVPGNPLYSHTFVERIAYLRANPPGRDWDGTFTFTHK